MPAVTVDDIRTVIPVDGPAPGSQRKAVVSLTTAPSGFEGEGFPVRRAFAGTPVEMLDPFIHMDQMGEVEYAPGEPKGTPWHPHRGFETVTYMIDGTFQHRDSAGGGGLITNGDTQWMTAGSGILHIERPPDELVATGGLFHGIQLWVNLPAKDKMVPSRYQDIRADQVRLRRSPDGGALLRIITGELGDSHRHNDRDSHSASGTEDHATKGPGRTYTPITVVHATVSPGAELDVPWPRNFNALVYVLAGRGSVGADGRPFHTGQLAVLGAGDVIHLSADHHQDQRDPALEVLLLGGLPIREPVASYGPFVMNTRSELAQAFEDFNKGLMGVIPADERS
jgi:redox-sensitive bicupin YhaK (pirin superfamily)